MKKFTSKTQVIGEIGENIACKFLVNKGFSILERNYTDRSGEIDIVVKKDNIRFIEVKSVSCETINSIVSHETKGIRPEENMHSRKLQRLRMVIGKYLNTHSVGDWQCDLLCVFYSPKEKKAKIRVIENITI